MENLLERPGHSLCVHRKKESANKVLILLSLPTPSCVGTVQARPGRPLLLSPGSHCLREHLLLSEMHHIPGDPGERPAAISAEEAPFPTSCFPRLGYKLPTLLRGLQPLVLSSTPE